jgi:hypothetical protein
MANAPTALCRFVEFDALGSMGYHFYDESGYFLLSAMGVQDCQFKGGKAQFCGTGWTTTGVTNNLFERVATIFAGWGPLYAYNNLFYGGNNQVQWWGGYNYTFRDNSFDGATGTGVSYAGLINDHNAYLNGATRLLPSSATDVVLGSFTYATGALGNYYHSGTSLCNLGSRTAGQAGLYHYTVRADQAKELNSQVDLGFHYPSVGPQGGLVAYWPLDEGTGATAADLTGNGHTGTVDGAAWTNGQAGGALSFDGVNDRMTTLESSLLRLPGDMAVSFWMKRTGQASDWVRLVGKSGTCVRNYGVWVEPGTGRLLFQEYDCNTGALLNLFSITQTALNTWYHVAAVIEGATAYIYVNGIWDYRVPRLVPASVTSDPVTLGDAGYPAYFPGVLDEVRIYNRALTAWEVASLAGLPVLPTDTDGDGLPDYLEDKNGNGIVDSGETNWQSYDSLNGLSGTPGLQVLTPLR